MAYSTRQVVLVLLVFAFTLPSLAAEIVHNSPTLQQVPPAGDKMELQFVVKGTTDIDIPVKLLLNRDGKFEVIDIDPGHLGVKNNVVRDFTVYSPRRSLEYRFLVKDEAGETLSKRFTLTRDCQVDYQLTTPELAELAATEDERVALLAADASELEKEITQAAGALELLKEFKGLLQ
jgi:hypothetical protein